MYLGPLYLGCPDCPSTKSTATSIAKSGDIPDSDCNLSEICLDACCNQIGKNLAPT